jgi:hypothetical protein
MVNCLAILFGSTQSYGPVALNWGAGGAECKVYRLSEQY